VVRLFSCALLIVCVCTATSAWPEAGILPNEILLGQSCDLSGPAWDRGQGVRAGLLAALQQANAAGGVYGRTVRLVTLDDGYDPERAVLNTQRLINAYGVFALIGEVGARPSYAALPVAEKAGVPFLAPVTGAEFLYASLRPLLVNIRAGYRAELEQMVEYLVVRQKLTRIACFYQSDTYGLSCVKDLEKILAKRGLALVGSSQYESGTLAVKSAALSLLRSKPQAVILVGALHPCAAFIRLAKKLGMDNVEFCALSFAGALRFAPELGAAGEGVILSQVTPDPLKETTPLITEFAQAMRSHQPEATPGFASLEGYIAGRVFLKAAAAAGPNPTRASFMTALEDLGAFDIGGIPLSFSPSDHQGLDQVFLFVIHKGKIEPFESD
jgi:ABC-type branched-subunit amino acid transport system substrate-binding protein